MTVLGCALCGKFISLSVSPDGNPTAMANPDVFSTVFAECNGCGVFICDGCIGDSQQCPKCKAAVTMHQPGDGFAQEFARRLKDK